MGLLSKLEHVPPPTTTDSVEEAAPSPANDEEKGHTGLLVAENILQQHHHADPEAEKRVVRKLDFRVTPLVTALYLVSFLDRSNIGNARIAGMTDDLELTGKRYTWLLNMFYITYILFEFQVIMWKIMPPHIWATIVVTGWGLIATLQAATFSWSGEMACRFFLGITEAGFGPGIPYLLSFFYLRHEIGLRIGVFLAAAPLANTFAGALAYGITSGHSKLANWRLLFLVEGIPTLLLAPVAFFFLPDSADKARFLTEDEKIIAKARGVRQVGTHERVGGIVWKDIGLTLLDAKAWFTALMYFSCNVSFSSLPVFLPTVLSGMGFSSINAQGLTAPPYFISFLVTIFSTYVADRTQQRGYTIMFLSCVGGIGYILLAACSSVGARYFGVFLAACGVFPCIANILPWVLNNQGSDTRRGTGIAMLNLIGQCGPLLGTNVFPTSQGPRYVEGQSICAAFIFFNGFLAFGLRTMLKWENKKLDEKYGPPMDRTANRSGDPQGKESVVSEENYGPTFRYILNAVRFYISDLHPDHSRIIPTIFQSRLPISLHDVQLENGQKVPIPEHAMQAIIKALYDFRSVCSDFGVAPHKVLVIGTEATRTAINGPVLLDRIRDFLKWNVRQLSEDEEDIILDFGVASSIKDPKGLAIELAGGTLRIHWIDMVDGIPQRPNSRAFRFPYGAAALKQHLEQAELSGAEAVITLRNKIKSDLSGAFMAFGLDRDLKVFGQLTYEAPKLYLTGSGFRGWGFMVMKHHEVRPYPIPTINGFEINSAQLLPSAIELDLNITMSHRLDARRMSQMPAVAFLMDVLAEVVPKGSRFIFAQGGVREGLIFNQTAPDIRAQHPLTQATLRYRPTDYAAMLRDIRRGCPTQFDRGPQITIPDFVTSERFLGPLVNLLNYHATYHGRGDRASSALRSTTTGILDHAHGMLHWEQALLAIALCERWGADVPLADVEFRKNLMKLVGPEKAWWARYIGIIGKAIGDAYPAGVRPTERVRLYSYIFRKGGGLAMDVEAASWGEYMGSMEWMEPLRRLGDRNDAVGGFHIEVKVNQNQCL
ncbi:hypothetical protein MMC13_002796 [Lambiella insularis]|nr:hypothetical protein [Lambiella insularis]